MNCCCQSFSGCCTGATLWGKCCCWQESQLLGCCCCSCCFWCTVMGYAMVSPPHPDSHPTNGLPIPTCFAGQAAYCQPRERAAGAAAAQGDHRGPPGQGGCHTNMWSGLPIDCVCTPVSTAQESWIFCMQPEWQRAPHSSPAGMPLQLPAWLDICIVLGGCCCCQCSHTDVSCRAQSL